MTAIQWYKEYSIQMASDSTALSPLRSGTAAITLPRIDAVAANKRPEDEVVAMFEQLRNPLLRYLLSFRITTPDAEEIAQEVFLALFQHLRRGKSRANLQGWLFKVAHNLALKNRLKTRRETPAASGSTAEAQEDRAPGPEQRMADLQRQARLLAVVEALPEVDRCCLSLRAEGLPYREISDILGISLGAVANSLARSLARLSRADECRGSCAAQ
jgi:RNA polymerase sigma-70 factor (ECF subfamily)